MLQARYAVFMVDSTLVCRIPLTILSVHPIAENHFLAFIDMPVASTTALKRGDDLASDPISITEHLPFNRVKFDTVYVSRPSSTSAARCFMCRGQQHRWGGRKSRGESIRFGQAGVCSTSLGVPKTSSTEVELACSLGVHGVRVWYCRRGGALYVGCGLLYWSGR